MKRVKTFVLMLCSFAMSSLMAQAKDLNPPQNTTQLAHGYVQVYDLGDIRLHAYQTKDLMFDECFVLETDKNLVAIESPAFDQNIEEWKQYVATLNKPLTDILISYHPAGGKWYGDAQSHATAAAKAAMSEGGATKALTKSLGQAFGGTFNTEIPVIDKVITAGTNTIGGVTFEIIDAGDGYDIAIPAIQSIYVHMLGADTHSILAGEGHANAVLASLADIQSKGYQLILSSHYTPETQADVEVKINYIKKVKELATQSKDKADFLARVKKAFPDYAGDNYLEMTAGYFFP